ncbi:MAG TPA: DUF4340 domain-containing protein [Verrucomicrobiae bacterium]|jgi:hypothetical protein|nr:DUF4340 domain-containing protein [Verrucomicrobiae bacterium]
MNLKQLGILIVLVILIGAAGIVLHNRQSASWTESNAEVGKKLLGDFPFNDVTHISIQHATNDVDLVKKDGLWRVGQRGDYPANFSQISEFLLKVRDLKIVQSEPASPTELARMDLTTGQGSNSATVVEFLGQSNQPIRTLLAGKKHLRKPSAPSQMGGDEGFPDGRFVKAGTNTSNVALISDPLDNVNSGPEQWLNKDFIHVEKPKSIAAVFPVTTNSWKLTRATEAGEWTLADARSGEELDSSKSSGVTSPFSSASFTDVLPQSKADQLGTNKPTILKIETFDDFNYAFNIGAKTNDDYLVTLSITANFPPRPVGVNEKPEDKPKIDKIYNDAQQKLKDKFKQEQSFENWTYLMPGWEVDPLLKPRSELLAEKKEEPKPSSAQSSEKSADTNEVKSVEPAPVH